MKLELGYAGDSSDGEEQDQKEDLYLEDNSYISHIKDGIKLAIYQYEYIFKDIGGRLHHKSVSFKYFSDKTSYYSSLSINPKLIANLKEKVLETTQLINDQYIVGKYKFKNLKERVHMNDIISLLHDMAI